MTINSGGAKPMGQLIQELKRRNIIRVAIAYAVSAWLLIEVTATRNPIRLLAGASRIDWRSDPTI
jgi:hypothetical protein